MGKKERKVISVVASVAVRRKQVKERVSDLVTHEMKKKKFDQQVT